MGHILIALAIVVAGGLAILAQTLAALAMPANVSLCSPRPHGR